MIANLPSRLSADRQMSEFQFARMVDGLKSDPFGSDQLAELLHEENPVYDQRGTGAIIRMRGWVLLAMGQQPLSSNGLLFVLEELDNGRDAYLVAAAARSLRNGAQPDPAMAPFLIRGLINIQFHDDLVSLERYGGYATFRRNKEDKESGVIAPATAVDELLAALRWLRVGAREVLPEMEALLADNDKGGGALSPSQSEELRSIVESVRDVEELVEASRDCCRAPSLPRPFRRWLSRSSSDGKEIASVVFEDQDGKHVTFGEFFHGRPSVVAFFYSRCTNPFKCSLTVAKLARLQKLLTKRGMDARIRTAAITYDPEFDLAERLHGYGASRGVRMDGDNRLLRPVEGIDALREYFPLGVNFVGSVVNRHRVELYVLDGQGHITASFERIQWDENEVLNCVTALLVRQGGGSAFRKVQHSLWRKQPIRPEQKRPHLEAGSVKFLRARLVEDPAKGSVKRSGRVMALPILALGMALFPKCPVCWTAYASVFGIAGLEQLPYSPWLLPVLACLILINLGSLWLQSRGQASTEGFFFAAAGAFMILVPGLSFGLEYASLAGVLLTLTGSLLSVFSSSLRSAREA